MLFVSAIDDVFVQIDYDDVNEFTDVLEYFTIVVDGYRFMPAYRSGRWDGKIRLLSMAGRLYRGLLGKFFRFAESNNYQVDVESVDELFKEPLQSPKGYIASLNPTRQDDATKEYVPITPYDHQENAVEFATGNNRGIVLSPTSSGKSLTIYALTRWYTSHNKPVLIIVPTKGLVEQLRKDFIDYSHSNQWDADANIHLIYQGKDKHTDKPVVISTWQSIYKEPVAWFSRFRVVIVDEAHKAKAASIKRVMEALKNCPYRIGLTGTIKDAKVDKNTLEGLFGDTFKAASTRELMDDGKVAKIQIRVLKLIYPEHIRQIYKAKASYAEEFRFVERLTLRNDFIADLAISRKENTLVLFTRRAHGQRIYKKLLKRLPKDRKVFYVDGGVDIEDREAIRRQINDEEGAIIVASYGVFSTGINIERLFHIIFASTYKEKVVILQSIGRGLRNAADKTLLTVYDITDDLHWKKRPNHLLRHMKTRLELYAREKFNYTMIPIELEEV